MQCLRRRGEKDPRLAHGEPHEMDAISLEVWVNMDCGGSVYAYLYIRIPCQHWAN